MRGVPHLFKPDEAAPLLRVSGRTVRRWVKEGKLAAIKQPGGRVLITAEAIAEYIDRDPTEAVAS